MNKLQDKNNNWFTIVKIQRNIWGIAEFGHSERVISYLIVGKNEALLFDTGMGIGNIKDEVIKITNLPILVVNSHTHFDHVGGNYQFDNIAVFDHAISIKNTNGFTQKSMFGAHNKANFLKKPPHMFNYGEYSINPFNWHRKIDVNECLVIEPFCFNIVYTPGHSPDSICLYEKKVGILFSGDTLYPGNIYLHLPESNLNIYKKSLKTISTLSNIKHIYPSHNAFSFPLSGVKKIYNICNQIPHGAKGKFILNKKIAILL